MSSIRPVAASLILLATTALAHDGVKNPAVMARMHAMKDIGANLKVMAEMAKGAQPFDAAAARDAARKIAEHAAATPALFEALETDPKSEAAPVIWDKFESFSQLALELEAAAAGFAASVETKDDLSKGLKSLGAACKACHSEYRVSR